VWMIVLTVELTAGTTAEQLVAMVAKKLVEE
jgi:hypothetical protein